MKNLTITITNPDGEMLFETTTAQIAADISIVDPCTVEQLHAEDVADTLRDELRMPFYNKDSREEATI